MIDQINLKQFDDIYEKTYNHVLKYIVCKCSNMEDVNDIIQETYLEVYKAIVKNKNIEDIDKYIIGIAKNKVNKYYTLLYRIQSAFIFSNKYNELEILDNIKDDVDIEKIVIKTDDIEKIWCYLKTKKIIIQKIFYLYYELDLTIKQIAQELNVGESYIKNCLYRTLNELQKILGKDCV